MIILEVRQSGSSDPQMFISEKDSVSIGRHSSNDIRIEDDAASRFHAEIERRGVQYYLRDLDSRNGTLVNQAPMLEHMLSEGDRVTIGQTHLIFHTPEYIRPRKDEETTRIVVVPAPELGPDMPKPQFSEVRDMPEPGAMVREAADSIENRSTPLGKTHPLEALQIAARMAEVVGGASDLGELLRSTLEFLGQRVNYQRAVALVWDSAQNSYVPRAWMNRVRDEKGEKEIAISMTIINYCLENRQGIACMDAMSDPRFAQAQSVMSHGLRSVVCVPIAGCERVLGVIHLDARPRDRVLADKDLEMTMLVVNTLAPAVESHLTRESRRQRERRGDQARVLTAAAHCFENFFLLSEPQERLLREAVAKGDGAMVGAALDQLVESQRGLARSIRGLTEILRGGVKAVEPIDLDQLVAGVLDEVSPALVERGIVLNFASEPLPASTFGDSEALRILVINLVQNAIEAMESSEHKKLNVAISKDGRGKITLSLNDTGEGMDEETRGQAFEPFFSTRGQAHAGLGLTYVRQIALAHGGAVECQSTPLKGTQMVVNLPVRKQPADSVAREASSAPWLFGD